MHSLFRGKGTFRLRDLLLGSQPSAHGENTSAFSAARIDGIDVDALVYFSVSVFWRASARSWSVRGTTFHPIRLGFYRDQLRLFLLEKAPFPKHCSLTVWVPGQQVPLRAVRFAQTHRVTDFYAHSIYLPGLYLQLNVGQQLGGSIRRGCVVRRHENPIFCQRSQ